MRRTNNATPLFAVDSPQFLSSRSGKMSVSQLRLASYTLEEHYGEIVRDVGLCLLKKGVMTLASLKKETKLTTAKVFWFFLDLIFWYRLSLNFISYAKVFRKPGNI